MDVCMQVGLYVCMYAKMMTRGDDDDDDRETLLERNMSG